MAITGMPTTGRRQSRRHAHRILGAVLAAGVAAGIAAAPPMANAVGSPAARIVNGDILVLVDTDLYLIRPDGRNLRRIARLGTDYDNARFSPDGSKIVASVTTPGHPDRVDLFLMRGDGSARQNLTATFDRDEYDPSFSRDGSKVAFRWSDGGSESGVAFMDARPGAPVTQVIHDGPDTPYCREDGTWPDGSFEEPVWSPVRDQLAVFHNCFTDPTGGDMIRILGPLGKPLAAYGTHGDAKSRIDFSPDGRKLAYEVQDDNWETWVEVLDRGTGATKRLTGMRDSGGVPAWSPNGARIATTIDGDLYTIRASDGRDRRRVKDFPDERVVQVMDWRAAR